MKISTEHRDEWNDLIASHGPYDMFTTLTFSRKVSDSEAIGSYNFLLHEISKKLWKRHKKKGLFNSGFVFAERQANDNLHFHSLVKFSPTLTAYAKDCYEGTYRSCAKILTAERNGRDVPITESVGIDIQSCDNNERLIDYLTKEMKGSNKGVSDSISALSLRGVDLIASNLRHLPASESGSIGGLSARLVATL